MRGITMAAAAALACALAAQASAEDFDRTPLFAEGEWSVAHTYDAADGSSWCAADTDNEAGQWFSFVAYDDGAAALVVGDPAWRLAPREIAFRIDVDAEQWDVTGAGADEAVSVALDDAEATAAFVAQLMEGRALAVFNSEDRRLAAFSLDGSRSALTALFDCWTRIEVEPPAAEQDPFIRASDPF